MVEATNKERGNDPSGPDATETPNRDGVQIDLISRDRLSSLASMEKIRLILDGVHDGNIVILEDGLSPEEESKLIEVTMSEISPDGFSGIEIESYPHDSAPAGSLLDRFIGRPKDSRMTVIGPANQLETLHKDETVIQALVSRR